MLESFGQIALKCWKSRLGRLLFFIHLIFALGLVGYYYNYIYLNFGTDLHLIAAWRKVYLGLNWPQIFLLEACLFPFWRPIGSRFGDGIVTFLVSIPWWIYGFIAEEGARMIRSRLVWEATRHVK